MTELKHWEIAPVNAAMEKYFIPFAITTHDLKTKFLKKFT